MNYKFNIGQEVEVDISDSLLYNKGEVGRVAYRQRYCPNSTLSQMGLGINEYHVKMFSTGEIALFDENELRRHVVWRTNSTSVKEL